MSQLSQTEFLSQSPDWARLDQTTYSKDGIPSPHPWQLAYTLNVYRLFISGALTILFIWDVQLYYLGQSHPQLFYLVSFAYLLLTLAHFILLERRYPSYSALIVSQIICDIVALGLLMHASGGMESGIAMLLFVPIAATGILLRKESALAMAMLACLFILIEHAYRYTLAEYPLDSLTFSIILCASFIASTLFTSEVSNRIRTQETLSQKQNEQLTGLQKLNEYIIQQMRSGVIVLDAKAQVAFMNESAWLLLGMPSKQERESLCGLSKALNEHYLGWQSCQHDTPIRFKTSFTGPELIAEFAELKTQNQQYTLVFINDTSQMTQQAQQLKLASLGQLVASIAHEVRNPLGAISHATQLLQEASQLPDNDRHLLTIIANHTARINTIIENILQLSRRKPSAQETLNLHDWLEHFMQEFRYAHPELDRIQVHIEPIDTHILFDTEQLRQVLNNLCENGLRYSQQHTGEATLSVVGGITPESKGPYLDIVDQGAGVDKTTAEHMFEPFYTTHNQGTGLGLYIARELCEINQAQLDYLPMPNQGSCFRITFPHPRRLV